MDVKEGSLSFPKLLPQQSEEARLSETEAQSPDAAYAFFGGKSFKDVDYMQGFPLGGTRTEFVLESIPTLREGPSTMMRSSTVRHIEQMVQKAGVQHFETPMQCLQRLRGEVAEMQDFVTSFSESRKELGPEEAASQAMQYFQAEPAELLAELAGLEGLLASTLSDEATANAFCGAEPVPTKKSSLDVVHKQLQALDQRVAAASGKGKAPPDVGGTVQYELFYTPSMAPLVDSARLASIEQRLATLESSMGTQSGTQFQLPFADLHSGLRQVASRLTVLDAGKLDALSRRISTVSTELDALLKRREKLPQGDSQPVDQLYELCERWRLTAAALPATLQRLRLLRALHQEAAGMSYRMNILEKQQEELSRCMEGTRENLETLKATMADNMAWVRLTVDSMQATAEGTAARRGG